MEPTPHPIATFENILWSRPRAAACSLLTTPGLELTYNGRGALLQACLEIAARGKSSILVPAFHCPSGISPAIHAGLVPVFYRIRRDLSIDYADLMAKVDANTSAVLVIHYFGLKTDLQPLLALRDRGIDVIEDWSHSFVQLNPLRLAGGVGDYCIYSFWKLAPSMVGGGVWRRVGGTGSPRPELPPPPLLERLIRSKKMFEDALDRSDLARAKAVWSWIEATRRAMRRRTGDSVQDPEGHRIRPGEDYYPLDLSLARSRMPWLARRVLLSQDLSSMAHQRRANFVQYGQQLLASNNEMKVVCPSLPSDACPWIFPILLQRRDEIDHRWRAAGVALHTFGIYLHSALYRNADEATVSDARFLSEHLLCLSVHQGIGTEQVKRSADTINRFLASANAGA